MAVFPNLVKYPAMDESLGRARAAKVKKWVELEEIGAELNS